MAKNPPCSEEIEDHLRKYRQPALAIFLSAHFFNHRTFVPSSDDDCLSSEEYKFKDPQRKLEALAGIAQVCFPRTS